MAQLGLVLLRSTNCNDFWIHSMRAASFFWVSGRYTFSAKDGSNDQTGAKSFHQLHNYQAPPLQLLREHVSGPDQFRVLTPR